jgi:AbrB family looped-hinge helix DNA binding protein
VDLNKRYQIKFQSLVFLYRVNETDFELFLSHSNFLTRQLIPGKILLNQWYIGTIMEVILMSTLTRLTSGGQVTLPKEIRMKTNMQPGDFVEVQLDEEGRIILTPKKLVNANQAYFWTEEWQKEEHKADEDIKIGRVKRFKSTADAVKYLEDKA